MSGWEKKNEMEKAPWGFVRNAVRLTTQPWQCSKREGLLLSQTCQDSCHTRVPCSLVLLLHT